jgi:hypothetical protein
MTRKVKCLHGHSLTELNAIIYRAGKRRCRLCRNAEKRKAWALHREEINRHGREQRARQRMSAVPMERFEQISEMLELR